MPSVHDNYLYAYAYDARTSVLVLRTVYPHTQPEEFTDVWFTGVWTHHIESVLGNDIVFDVAESDAALEQKTFRSVFDRLKNYGWPNTERAGETFADLVTRKQLRVWHLSSSYGAEGFVVAKDRMILHRESGSPGLEPPSTPVG